MPMAFTGRDVQSSARALTFVRSRRADRIMSWLQDAAIKTVPVPRPTTSRIDCRAAGRSPKERSRDTCQASSGTPSLTVSSWPTVSLPNSTGTKAPIDATTTRVPKKIVGRAGVRLQQEGRQHAGDESPARLAKILPAPAQRRRELLGEVNPHGREGRQHGKAGDQRSGDEHDRRVMPRGMRHRHHQKAGKRSGEAISDRPPPPDDLHQEPGKALAGNARQEHQRAQPKAQR